MEKIAEKKNKKVPAAEPEVLVFDEKLGVTFTLDNSLSRFANDPFIIEHTKRAERKLSKSSAID